MFSGVSKWGFSFLIVLFYSFFIGFIRFLVVLGFSFRNFFPFTFVPCICTTYYCIFVCFFFFFCDFVVVFSLVEVSQWGKVLLLSWECCCLCVRCWVAWLLAMQVCSFVGTFFCLACVCIDKLWNGGKG